MAKRLTLFVLAILIATNISSCTKTIVRKRIVVGDVKTQAVVDSLQTQIRECEKVMNKCCDIVLEDLKNN